MKTSKRRENEEAEKTNYWDAFKNHLDMIYFSGASELLDEKLITYEYEIFKSYLSGHFM